MLFFGVCVVMWGDPVATARARAAESPAAQTWPVSVGIQDVAPVIPKAPADMFSIKGAVKNTSSKTLSISVKLEVSKVKTRWDMSTKAPTGYDGVSVGKPQPINGTTLTPQNQSTWVIPQMPIKDLLAPFNQAPSVYAVDAVAVDGTGKVVGVERTFLPWAPMSGGGSSKVSVALAWPVAGPPALTASITAGSVPLLADTGNLTAQLGTDERLDRVVKLGKELGPAANWVVDPDLFYTANQLKNGFAGVSTSASSPATTPTSGQPATDWLNEVTGALKGANCWSLPYADPDLATLSRSAQGLALLKSVSALGPGSGILDCDQRDPDHVLAWPADGQADQPTAAAIRQDFPHATALVGNTYYTEQNDKLAKTHVTLDGKSDALVSDAYLDGVFAPAPDDGVSDAGLLAGQRWLAQTAMMARENLVNHSAIAAPPRNFDPTKKLVTAMRAEASLPPDQQWMSCTTLQSLKNAPVTDNYKTPAKQWDATANANLSAATLGKATTTQSVYSAFLSILKSSDADRLVPFRMVATWWRGPEHSGQVAAYADAVEAQVWTMHDSVYLTPVLPLTLSGKSGKIPITVKNDLPVQVVVNVQASSQLTNRLAVTAQPGQVVVPRNGTKTVQVPVRVVGNGQTVKVDAALYQPGQDGRPADLYYPAGASCPKSICVGPPKQGQVHAFVHVSAIGIVALALMIGSAAVLVVAIGLRVVRANRAHHAPGHDTMAS